MNKSIDYPALLEYVNERKDYLTAALKRLVKVPSVRSEPRDRAPFGDGCAKALIEAEKIYRENGYETELRDRSGYLLAFTEAAKKRSAYSPTPTWSRSTTAGRWRSRSPGIS